MHVCHVVRPPPVWDPSLVLSFGSRDLARITREGTHLRMYVGIMLNQLQYPLGVPSYIQT